MEYKSLIICCFKVSNANYHWDGIKVLVWGFCCIKSSSLELDLNKLGFLSVALQIRSQYPGSWQGKRIFSSWENCTRPTGWKGLRHDQPPYCLYSTSEHIFIPSFHFSPYYVTFFFFFLRGWWLSSDSAEPPSVIPLRGLGNSQNTRPWLMWSVLTRKNLSLTPKLFICACAAESHVHTPL